MHDLPFHPGTSVWSLLEKPEQIQDKMNIKLSKLYFKLLIFQQKDSMQEFWATQWFALLQRLHCDVTITCPNSYKVYGKSLIVFLDPLDWIFLVWTVCYCAERKHSWCWWIECLAGTSISRPRCLLLTPTFLIFGCVSQELILTDTICSHQLPLCFSTSTCIWDDRSLLKYRPAMFFIEVLINAFGNRW